MGCSGSLRAQTHFRFKAAPTVLIVSFIGSSQQTDPQTLPGGDGSIQHQKMVRPPAKALNFTDCPSLAHQRTFTQSELQNNLRVLGKMKDHLHVDCQHQDYRVKCLYLKKRNSIFYFLLSLIHLTWSCGVIIGFAV